jgi:hypothetical protein
MTRLTKLYNKPDFSDQESALEITGKARGLRSYSCQSFTVSSILSSNPEVTQRGSTDSTHLHRRKTILKGMCCLRSTPSLWQRCGSKLALNLIRSLTQRMTDKILTAMPVVHGALLTHIITVWMGSKLHGHLGSIVVIVLCLKHLWRICLKQKSRKGSDINNTAIIQYT